MRAPRSLRARIVLAALAGLFLSVVVTNTLLLAAVERDGRRTVDDELRERAERVVGPPGRSGRPGRGGFGGRDHGREGREPLLAGSGAFVQVAAGGRIVEQRGDVPADAPGVPERDGYATVDIGGEAWRSLTVSTAASGAGGALRIQNLSSLEPVRARVARVRRLVIGLGLLALALTALAAWAFTTLALRPLARLREGAQRVSGADNLRPLPDEGPEEVRSVAGALNEMLERLGASNAAMQRALQATRRFAADAGHELRTPLTGLRANLEALERNPDLPIVERQALLRDTLAEQQRMVHLLEGLQALARGEAAESLPREDVELADLIDAAVYQARRRHPDVGFAFSDEAGDAILRGWAGGLRLLVDNLLANAALHGRVSGRVRVRLERDAGSVLVSVEDDGPGIAADARAALLEPFARGPGTTAPGTGLGLAIVAQQVALHGGDLRLADSPLGGLAVEVRLPTSLPGEGPAPVEAQAPAGSR